MRMMGFSHVLTTPKKLGVMLAILVTIMSLFAFSAPATAYAANENSNAAEQQHYMDMNVTKLFDGSSSGSSNSTILSAGINIQFPDITCRQCRQLNINVAPICVYAEINKLVEVIVITASACIHYANHSCVGIVICFPRNFRVNTLRRITASCLLAVACYDTKTLA